jgi:uncharacterized protein with von Willebrand factor type A (vWA) domain
VTYPFGGLPENLAAFCGFLRREYGFRTGPRELQDAARALQIADLTDEHGVRNMLRPVLAGRFEEAQDFDGAFERFFHGHREPTAPPWPGAGTGLEKPPPSSGEARTTGDIGAPRPAPSASDTIEGEINAGAAAVPEASDVNQEPPTGMLRASYSPLEGEGVVPDLEPADREWRVAAAALARRARARLSRRWRPALRGRRFDLRRTMRASLHTGGDFASPRWRGRQVRAPRFIVLVDGSRSMAASARAPLQMAVALTAVSPETETFTFSTALRRVTPDARRAAAGQRRPLRLQQAWGGGTTIGACLDDFLRRFGGTLISREAIVVIASDGLDVGDPGLLRRAMETLARRSAAVLWLNPLAATPGYEPAAVGVRLARPFVSVFGAGTDPKALQAVARALSLR